MLNETGLDQLEIVAGTTEHHADLCELARHLNTVNLPNNPEAIRALLETSERSFSGELKDPRKREYVFVLWDDAKRRAVGTSMIIGQLGRRGVPYIYLEVRSEEKYSATLDRHFIHRVLTTRYSYDGPTEVGGLVMHPESRRSPQRLGSLISYVRFLFIAMHRKEFRDEVLAELLPPFEPDGTSLLWEAYGRRFTGLSYREADQLSKSNKEFVSGLFPSEIYATLLSEEAQRVIGEVGAETRGVEKMLRRIGFRYAERVDPFDGGPHFTCPTDQISLVQLAHERPIVAVASGGEGRTERALLARSYDGPPYFKAVPVLVEPGLGSTVTPLEPNTRIGVTTQFSSNSHNSQSGSEPRGGGGPGGDSSPVASASAEAGLISRGHSSARRPGDADASALPGPPANPGRGDPSRELGPPVGPPAVDGAGSASGRIRGASGDERTVLVSPSSAARLGFLDRGTVFWMPIP